MSLQELDFLENYKRVRRVFFPPTRPIILRYRAPDFMSLGPIWVTAKFGADQKPGTRRSLSVTKASTILRETCDRHALTLDELTGWRRTGPIVIARQEAMYRLAAETSLSYSQIANRLKRSHHTTALFGMQQHARRNGLPRVSRK